MNKQSMMIRIGTALAVLAVLTASASATATVWFEPDPSTIDLAPGETVNVQIMSDVDATEDGIRSFQIGVDFDPSVINITVEQPLLPEPYGGFGMAYWTAVHTWDNPSDEDPGPLGAWVWIIGSNSECYMDTGSLPMNPPLPVPLANLSIEGIGHGTSPLNITTETRLEPTRGDTRIINCSHVTMDAVYNNNAIVCTGGEELCLGTCYVELNCTGNATENVSCKDCISVAGLSWSNYEFESPCNPNYTVPRYCYESCPECCDGTDNDADGFIDWPVDPECECCLDEDELNDDGCEVGPCVPELATVALFSVGLLGLIGAIWRRRYD